jgi:pimeloyl-ACP methyl ester carboxylesterase
MRNIRQRARSAVLGILLTLPATGTWAGVAPTAPPLGIDLNAFDRSKQTMLLPNGITLGYVALGPRVARPVVLSHGYTDNARDWVPMLPYLDKDQRLILLDLRGHGASSKPECCYTRIDIAYDIRLLLDRLNVADADIVGHSFGSVVAQSFAELWPERTHRLVLISSRAGSHPDCTTGDAKPMDYRSAILKLKEPIDPDSPWMIEWWASPTPVDEDFIRRQRKDAAAIPLKIWIAILDQGLTGGDLQSALPMIKAPTLAIWGGKDPIIVEKQRCALARGLPEAQTKTFPELGHNPFWEQPRAVAETIEAFLHQKP